MSDLTDFLLARIAEDEGWASRVVFDNGSGDLHSEEDRVLAECEAKRGIIGEHAPVDYSTLGMESPNACGRCGADLGMGDWEWVKDSFPCPTLRHLALPYADHPDYREEWKP